MSHRTIQWDTGSLYRAGIPISTAHGVGGGVTRLTCTETATAKHRWMRPFIPGYLKW